MRMTDYASDTEGRRVRSHHKSLNEITVKNIVQI